MSKEFLSPAISTKPAGTMQTPYERAQSTWDTRYGAIVLQAKNWRITCFVSSFVNVLLVICLLVTINQQQVIPILVGLDKERGEPHVLGPAGEKQYQPGPLEIKYFLSNFIRLVRAVPLDEVLIKQNWGRAYAFLKPAAGTLLNEMTAKDSASPLNKIGKLVVNVQPLSVVSLPNTDSYQVRWMETVYTSTGQKLDEYSMLGTFIIQITPPKDEQSIHENPLGLFITNFQWNREL